MSWSSALLAVGALSVAVFGALVSGAVTNPFLPSSSGSTADDESADGIVGAGPEPLTIVVPDEIAPRNAQFMRPGTVDAIVLPPIPTDDWTVDDLPARIAAVRQAYIETLANWGD